MYNIPLHNCDLFSYFIGMKSMNHRHQTPRQNHKPWVVHWCFPFFFLKHYQNSRTVMLCKKKQSPTSVTWLLTILHQMSTCYSSKIRGGHKYVAFSLAVLVFHSLYLCTFFSSKLRWLTWSSPFFNSNRYVYFSCNLMGIAVQEESMYKKSKNHAIPFFCNITSSFSWV